MAKEEFLKPYRIAEIIRSDIAEYPVHASLPTERQLAEHFGVSRVTVQKALTFLEREGRIYRRQGSGSFVAPERQTRYLKLRSFSEEMALRGIAIRTEVIRFDKKVNTKSVEPWALVKKPAYRIERLRLGNKMPLSWEITYISQQVAPDLEKSDLTKSLYQILELDYKVEIASADEFINPVLTNNESSDKLDMPEGIPVLEIVRNGFDTRGELIETTKSIRRADQFDLRFTVRRR